MVSLFTGVPSCFRPDLYEAGTSVTSLLTDGQQDTCIQPFLTDSDESHPRMIARIVRKMDTQQISRRVTLIGQHTSCKPQDGVTLAIAPYCNSTNCSKSVLCEMDKEAYIGSKTECIYKCKPGVPIDFYLVIFSKQHTTTSDMKFCEVTFW